MLLCQSWIRYYNGRNCLWKKIIFANWVFCLQVWNICTVNSMRHQKRIFLLCIEHAFVCSSSLYYFQKLKQQKMILNRKWSFWRELMIWNKKYCRFCLMFEHTQELWNACELVCSFFVNSLFYTRNFIIKWIPLHIICLTLAI